MIVYIYIYIYIYIYVCVCLCVCLSLWVMNKALAQIISKREFKLWTTHQRTVYKAVMFHADTYVQF